MSDRVFHGWRSGAGILFLGGVGVALIIYWQLPPTAPMGVFYLFIAIIGGLIYGPVMLIGLQAIRVASETPPDSAPQHLGEVVDLEPGIAQDRLVVRTPDGERVAVPFVAELVPEIDPDAGTITLAPPGGLFPGVGRTEEAR